MNEGHSGRRYFFGAMLLSAASVSKLGLQLILVPILARILGPSVFGLMSIAMSIVLLANMLSDGGMGNALVREREPSKELESTIFWISVVIGFALAACVALFAWPAAVIFEQPELMPVLFSLAPVLVLSSAISVPNARVVRNKGFAIFAAGDLASAIFSAAIGIMLALRGFGVWSLVAQQVVLWTVKATWITIAVHYRPSFAFRLSLARPLMGYSLHNLAAAIADFAGKSAPILIVGNALGIASVGHFSMAYQLTRATDMVIAGPVNFATFSALATARDENAIASFVSTALRLLLTVLTPLFCGLCLTADLITSILLGERWIATAPALAALAPGALLFCIYGFISSALLGVGSADRSFKLTLHCGIAISVGALIGAQFGIVGAAAGLSLATIAIAPLYIRALIRKLGLSFSQIISTSAIGILGTATMAVVVLLIRHEAASLKPFLQLVAAVGTGAIAYPIVALLIGGHQIREDIQRILRREKGTAAASQRPSFWRLRLLPLLTRTQNPTSN
jgi:PST family polysaccharide transporter